MERELSLCISVAKSCGQMIRDAFYSDDKEIQHKGLVDLVTQTDKAVEKFAIETIRKEFPQHEFLAEESFDGTKYGLTEAPTWIIDPIDGTTNFVHKQPFLCISIALCVNMKIMIGCCYNPIQEELFHAVRGQGAYLNGKKIHVADAKQLHHAVVATNVGYDRSPEGIQFMTSNIKNLLEHNIQSLRCGGTAAMEICSVACGRFDVFYEFGIHPWDIAAGILMVEEAGGSVVDPITGGPLSLGSRRVFVCVPAILKVFSYV